MTKQTTTVKHRQEEKNIDKKNEFDLFQTTTERINFSQNLSKCVGSKKKSWIEWKQTKKNWQDGRWNWFPWQM